MFKGCRSRNSATISQHILQSTVFFTQLTPLANWSGHKDLFDLLDSLDIASVMWHPSWSHGFRSMWMHLRWATRPAVLEGKTLQQIQRRITALKRLQSSLLWPPLSEFEAFGHKHPLPLKTCGPLLSEVSVERLQYLAGFFDGDGCVTSRQGRPVLGVGLSSCSAEALLFFRDAFGGGISKKVPGRGLQKPALQWRLCSEALCLEAAQHLQKYSILKRSQLQLLIDWPSKSDQRRQAVQHLRHLKSCDFHEHGELSWPWLAGFVDAEGCIGIQPAGKHLSLSITQKDGAILEKISGFMQADGITTGQVRHDGRVAHYLSVNALESVLILLDNLLRNGLFLKREQAEAALMVKELSHDDLRRRISATAGNQMRYRRLDSNGCDRARKIRALNDKIRRSRVKLVELEEELSLLRKEHEYQNSITAYSTLRSDTKLLISQGAQKQHLVARHTWKVTRAGHWARGSCGRSA